MGLLSQFSSKAEMHRRETIKRFDDFIGSYLGALEAAENPDSAALLVTLVARSPESPVAAAVQRHGEQLALFGCEVRMIFASTDPACEFGEFAELAQLCNGEGRVSDTVRWARNPALLDAHEQLVLGTELSWSGDSMRRSSDSRFALDLFNTKGGDTYNWACMAFDGLWSASAVVPRSRFRTAGSRNSEPVIAQMEVGSESGFAGIPFSGSVVTRH